METDAELQKNNTGPSFFERFRLLRQRVNVKVNINTTICSDPEVRKARMRLFRKLNENNQKNNPSINVAPLFKLFGSATCNKQSEKIIKRGSDRRHPAVTDEAPKRKEVPRVAMETLNPRRPLFVLRIGQSAFVNILSSFFRGKRTLTPVSAPLDLYCSRCNELVNHGTHIC